MDVFVLLEITSVFLGITTWSVSFELPLVAAGLSPVMLDFPIGYKVSLFVGAFG